MSTSLNNKLYGVEIVGKTAYTQTINYSATAYGKQRNDFEGDKVSCLEFIASKGITEVYGVLLKEVQ